MLCLRHGEVEHVSTHNDNTLGGAIHFLSCGCFGTAEQLRDPDYDPNPPAAPDGRDERISELEAKLAALESRLNADEGASSRTDEPPATEPVAPVETDAAPEQPAEPAAPPAEQAEASEPTPAEAPAETPAESAPDPVQGSPEPVATQEPAESQNEAPPAESTPEQPAQEQA